MQKQIGEIPSLPPALDKAQDAARRQALESGNADAPEPGLDSKRQKIPKTKERAVSGNEKNAENLKGLRGKLEEYKTRLARAEERLKDAPERAKKYDTDLLDANYKIVATEIYLANGSINEDAVISALEEKGIFIDPPLLRDRISVIEDYAKTGGKKTYGGTGLDGEKMNRLDLEEEQLLAADDRAEAEQAREEYLNELRDEVSADQLDSSEKNADGAPEVSKISEGESYLAKEAALDKAEAEAEKARAEAEAGWKERVSETEARNRDAITATVEEAVKQVDAAETKEAAKMGRNVDTLAETLEYTAESFKAPSALIEGTKDFARDLSDSVISTTGTDWIRRGLGWLTGKHVEARTNPEDKHGGIFIEGPRTLKEVAKRFPEAFLNEMVTIPSDLARRLEEWSPNTAHERRQLAQEMEIGARETRDRILADIQKEKDALYRQGLSPENVAKLAELSDRGENVESDYADEVAKAREIAPGTVEGGLKNFAWVSVTAGLDALSYTLGMGHIVKEAGQALASGIRGERRKLFAERAPNAPYSKDVISINGPQEKTMGIMERLGDWMMTKALELQDDREELTDTLHEEVAAAKQKEASIMQDVISKRIEGLVEKIQLTKTRISKAEMEEIGRLTAGLNSARKGLLAAREIDAFIQRSRDLAENDDAKLLMGYLSGRAINSIKNLEVIPPEARKALIAELQEHPSPEALKAAESVIYASLDENVSVSGVTEIGPEQRAQLDEAHKVLQESVKRATDIYTSNLAQISAEITKGLQAANRELKKAAVEAEMAQSEEKAAA